ncbi:unnamed protein product [Leptosia nina]|uniref:Uncharacterized protein n=1 Tax=Leptosia nina TaxID=320188 RepID=A0AAV1J368_9NEOP
MARFNTATSETGSVIDPCCRRRHRKASSRTMGLAKQGQTPGLLKVWGAVVIEQLFTKSADGIKTSENSYKETEY